MDAINPAFRNIHQMGSYVLFARSSITLSPGQTVANLTAFVPTIENRYVNGCIAYFRTLRGGGITSSPAFEVSSNRVVNQSTGEYRNLSTRPGDLSILPDPFLIIPGVSVPRFIADLVVETVAGGTLQVFAEWHIFIGGENLLIPKI
jgi:hypothetical protein